MPLSRLKVLWVAACFLIAVPLVTFASNTDLQAIKDADQADRTSGLLSRDWRLLVKRDMERQGQVRQLLAKTPNLDGVDYFNAALVMQHGQSVDDYRLANALATIAAQIDPENANAKWLVAATWDRLLESMQQPQWYGTQFVKNAEGRVVLYPIADGVISDADRRTMHVPSLQEQQLRAQIMSQGAH